MITTLYLRRRKIDSLKRQLDDPAIGLPRVVWFFAALTGTGDHLHYVIRHRLQMRLERLQREQHALVEKMRHQNQARQIVPT